MKTNLQQAVLTTTRSQRGLTLAEIMVVIVILGVLAGIVFGGFFGILGESKGDIAKLQIKEIESKVLMYTQSKNKVPKSLDQAKRYLKDETVPKDPWGNEYIYSTSSSCGKKFELTSMGEDGKKGGGDDISNCDKEE